MNVYHSPMIRAQIVLDEPTAERLRAAAAQSGSSMSEIVRRALDSWFEHREPDSGWIGSLQPKRVVSHDLDDIRASVAAARKREHRR
jgi:Arc/MetJ-type ribon-helix-helix transcriptional regulator